MTIGPSAQVRILVGDALARLRELPAESVQCCVTSPPYWGLRDYGVPGQLGLEPTPDEYLAHMVEVFREVRRVLRDDGTCWANMGDSYARSPAKGGLGPHGKNGYGEGYSEARSQLLAVQRRDEVGVRSPASEATWAAASTPEPVPDLRALANKQLVGMPWRLAFALQADGWWLRQDIIWAKPNPMPESVTDRCTKAHEYLFLLSKSARYYYDQEPIREEAEYGRRPMPADSWDRCKIDPQRVPGRTGGPEDDPEAGRNARSVWTIPTAPFPEAHFATFPPELPRRCILAGSRPGDTVLDPFAGAGTTLLVANQLGRHAIGIELNPTYAAMAEKRIHDDAPLVAAIRAEEAASAIQSEMFSEENP